jgi:hypothetical protein
MNELRPNRTPTRTAITSETASDSVTGNRTGRTER